MITTLSRLKKPSSGQGWKNQLFYGAIRAGKLGFWTLWAGYCSYNFPAVEHLKLNFLNDFSRDLDTGGRNWPLLYKFHNQNQIRFAPRNKTELIDPLDKSISNYRVSIVDNVGFISAGPAIKKNSRKVKTFTSA